MLSFFQHKCPYSWGSEVDTCLRTIARLEKTIFTLKKDRETQQLRFLMKRAEVDDLQARVLEQNNVIENLEVKLRECRKGIVEGLLPKYVEEL